MSQQPSSIGEFASISQALDLLEDDQKKAELATLMLDVVQSQLADWARRYRSLGPDLSQHIGAHAQFVCLWDQKQLLEELASRGLEPQTLASTVISLQEELTRLAEEGE
jgi:hypothetical protein